MTQRLVRDTGISIVYEPLEGDSVVDIVIIHGLQGHPFRTWACFNLPQVPSDASLGDSDRKGKKRLLDQVLPLRLKKRNSSWLTESSSDVQQAFASSSDVEPRDCNSVFWPGDLLPNDCPKSRILVYGYDTKITKHMAGATNQNSLFSHAKDLLFALGRERQHPLPLIFIAHSVGGIVLKEMLACSSVSADAYLRSISESTAGVVFLGTPHRGSPELASLGEWARSVVSAFRVATTSTILDTLGLKTTDLERAQDSFSRLWQQNDFRVKTFQEGLALTGVNLGPLGRKVVPDYSSLIGDSRENAETLQANHMEMCRFSGAEDANYRKVAGEVGGMYSSLLRLHAPAILHRHAQIPNRSPAPSTTGWICLQSLRFPSMNVHYRTIEKPAEGTCAWLLKHSAYENWFNGADKKAHDGLLWLKGKPGAGKSTLMKEAYVQAMRRQNGSSYSTAAYFFSARGDQLQSSPAGLFRSLLCQLLPQDQMQLESFSEFWHQRQSERRDECAGDLGQDAGWEERELRSFFRSMFTQHSAPKTLIFVDALDECDPASIRNQAYFWRDITHSASARGNNLRVCLSSRHFPHITISSCSEIIVEDYNGPDIAHYVEQKFGLGIADVEPRWELLRDEVLRQSSGVFLWVVLVVDALLKSWDNGKGLYSLLDELNIIPSKLDDLFQQLFVSTEPETRAATLGLFRWAILSTRPLRLYEWHHILAFVEKPAPVSLREWRNSNSFTETDDQLERQIRSLSRGLLEVQHAPPSTIDSPSSTIGFEPEGLSDCAGAGSLDLEEGETRVVQVIHESVRQYFLTKGLSALAENGDSNPIGNGHISIMADCLDYLDIQELDELVEARLRYGESRGDRVARDEHFSPLPDLAALFDEELPKRYRRRASSVASFSSAGSHCTTWHIEEDLVPESNIRGSSKDATKLSLERAAFRATLPDSNQFMDFEDSPVSPQAAWGSIGARPQAARDSEVEVPVVREIEKSTESSPARCHSRQDTDSEATRSRLLEDHPSLLTYATFDLFAHARLASGKEGTQLTAIVRRLHREGSWRRWVALREDVPNAITFPSYIARLNLWPWLADIFSYTLPKDWDRIYSYENAVQEAADNGDRVGFGQLLETGRRADCQPRTTLLCRLAMRSDVAWLRAYLGSFKKGYLDTFLRYMDSSGTLPLHSVVRCFAQTGALELLALGADINDLDGRGWTPLRTVCDEFFKLGSYTTLRAADLGKMLLLLLDTGALVDMPDKEGSTPLLSVCARLVDEEHKASHLEVIRTLLKRGANINARDKSGTGALHRAADLCGGYLMTELLRQGAHADERKGDGSTALHLASRHCWTAGIDLLLKSGADVNAVDGQGQTALVLAFGPCGESTLPDRKLFTEALFRTIKVLLSAGADVNAVNGQGKTALMLALELREWSFRSLFPPQASFYTIELLLGAGADASGVLKDDWLLSSGLLTRGEELPT